MVKSPDVMLFQAVVSENKQETTSPVRGCRMLLPFSYLMIGKDDVASYDIRIEVRGEFGCSGSQGGGGGRGG